MLFLLKNYEVAYYSCDRNLARRIIKGKERIRPTRDSFGWFGRGIYLYEDPFGALSDAVDRANSGQIKDPAVIGVIFEPGKILNLVESVSFKAPEGPLLIRDLVEGGMASWSTPGKHCRMPFDTVYLRPYDNGSGNDLAAERRRLLCVLDPERIIGHFLAGPNELFNPGLDQRVYL